MSLRDRLTEMLRSDNNSGLARALGISRSTLARYQQDPDGMSLKTLKRLLNLKGYKVQIESKTQTFTL